MTKHESMTPGTAFVVDGIRYVYPVHYDTIVVQPLMSMKHPEDVHGARMPCHRKVDLARWMDHGIVYLEV
jgi:hypothetical protein